jgi:hypothetical protein
MFIVCFALPYETRGKPLDEKKEKFEIELNKK